MGPNLNMDNFSGFSRGRKYYIQVYKTEVKLHDWFVWLDPGMRFNEEF